MAESFETRGPGESLGYFVCESCSYQDMWRAALHAETQEGIFPVLGDITRCALCLLRAQFCVNFLELDGASQENCRGNARAFFVGKPMPPLDANLFNARSMCSLCCAVVEVGTVSGSES